MRNRKLERLSRQASFRVAKRAGFATATVRRRGGGKVTALVLAVIVLVSASVVADSVTSGSGRRDVGAAEVSETPFTPACPVTSQGDDHVEVAGPWAGEEARRFRTVLGQLAARTGTKVSYATGLSDTDRPDREMANTLEARIQSGCPPDIALLPQPGLLADLAGRNQIKPLPEDTAKMVRENYSQAWRALGSHHGKLYGVWYKASNKSLVWYRSEAFARAEVEPPRTWAGLLEVAEKLEAKGTTPFSVAGADGWTLTDWFENVYLRTAGPEMYDKLTRHEIAWTHPTVEGALEILRQVFSRPQWLAGGTDGALGTDFTGSVANVFGDRPTAAMVYEGDFVANEIDELEAKNAGSGDQAQVFPFPAVGSSKQAAMALGGDVAVLFNHAGESAQRLIRALATPAAAEPWARQGGFTSPNKELASDLYPDQITKESAELLANAKTIRFDLSDLQPPSFGGTGSEGMWKILRDFLRDPSDVKGTAKSLEEARLAAR